MTAYAMTADDAFDFESTPLRRHLMLALGVAAFLAVIGAGWSALEFGSREPVARLQVEGRFSRLKLADIDAAARPLIDRRFGDLDLIAVREAVEALPWTSRASVERVWPATVRVRAWERVPFARWGDDALLDADARVFRPAPGEVPDGLPQLSGPTGHEATVAEMFRALSVRLIQSSFPLQGLGQDARGEWTARTAGGVELRFGREDPQEKTDMLLGAAERALKDRIADVKYVDLRYTNGFSVGWITPPKQKKESH
ncbi:cell division protein FtsQ/DivIB [Solimonas flava]|uniref:cell division protein FtsQ/DivIB n=1 Tax=Solimonas flava TaxID=415849 RepID=UPI0006874DAA|nr:cell division protein FtsQ/DivIB [Solimonas flava]